MNVKKRLVEPQIFGVKPPPNSTNQQLPLAPNLRTERVFPSQPGLPKQLPPVSRCTGEEVSDSQRFVSSLYLGEGQKMAVLQMKYTAWKKKGMPYKWWVLVVDRNFAHFNIESMCAKTKRRQEGQGSPQSTQKKVNQGECIS